MKDLEQFENLFELLEAHLKTQAIVEYRRFKENSRGSYGNDIYYNEILSKLVEQRLAIMKVFNDNN